MTVDQLIRTLRDKRIAVWTQDGRLRYRAPQGALTDDLRASIQEHRATLMTIVPAHEPAGEPVPVSHAQQAMWFLNRTMPESPAYNVAFAAHVASVVDVAALRSAAQQIVDRHPSLRTVYDEDDGAPIAFVVPAMSVHFRQIDAAKWDDATLHDRITSTYRVPFDLKTGPLIRFDLFTRAPDVHVLLLTGHHIALDGWSIWMVLDELRLLYGRATGAGGDVLPPLATDYANYALWQSRMIEGQEGRDHASYWSTKLSDELPPLELPTDHPRIPNRAAHGASYRVSFGRERTDRIKSFARESGATAFSIVLSAYALLLSRYADQEDVVVGTPMSGRTQSEFEGIVGCFVNPGALRVHCAAGIGFRQLVEETRVTVLEALAHQDYPFHLISKNLRKRNSADVGVFRADFAFQKPQRFTDVSAAVGDDEGVEQIDFGGLRVRPYDIPQQEGQLDLTLELIEGRGAFVGSFKYDANLFERDTIARMESHLHTLIDSALDCPDAPIGSLNMLPAAERLELLTECCGPATAFPVDKLYSEYFEEQVRRTPNAVAVTDDRGSLTYDEINVRANRLARLLIDSGLEPNQPVALLAERGGMLLSWILATLEAGGAYLPLDPRHPELRHVEILRQARPAFVVTSDALGDNIRGVIQKLESNARPKIITAGELDSLTGDPGTPARRVGANDAAYVIFTSGSTGVPKGAMVPHRAMLNHFWSKIRGYGFDASDIVLQSAPQSFDISVWQYLALLLVGGRVRVASDALMQEPARLLAFAESEGVTALELVPSMLRAFLDEHSTDDEPAGGAFGRLRRLLVGADTLSPDLCRRWLSRWPATAIFNTYGPTECADDTTRHLVVTPPATDTEIVPIGRPVDNVRVYVVDRNLQLVPRGVPGELCIGGASVGLGYINDPERTAAAFVADPFASSADAKLYRTGDRIRMRSDGELEFLGRIDNQVKIRGLRIELGEIERALATFSGVTQAVAVTTTGRDSAPRLVAFVTTENGTPIQTQDAQRFLRERLPEYMVPATIIRLDALPLSANGKIDRRSLVHLEETTPDTSVYEPPFDGTEQQLAQIWTDLLGAPRVGRRDSFFELGGHSILAARLMARLRRHMSVDLRVRALFESPTLAGLAEQIDRTRATLRDEEQREEFTL